MMMYAQLNKRFVDKHQNKKVQQAWDMTKYLNTEKWVGLFHVYVMLNEVGVCKFTAKTGH